MERERERDERQRREDRGGKERVRGGEEREGEREAERRLNVLSPVPV